MSVLETDPRQAIRNCTFTLSQDQLAPADRAEALKVRGRALYRTEHLDDAIGDYEAALKIAPDDPELHLRRGGTAFDKRDFDALFAHAHRALELRPGYGDVYGMIGAALSLGGPEKLAQARAAYDEAIRLQPDEPLARYNRFLLLKTQQLQQ